MAKCIQQLPEAQVRSKRTSGAELVRQGVGDSGGGGGDGVGEDAVGMAGRSWNWGCAQKARYLLVVGSKFFVKVALDQRTLPSRRSTRTVQVSMYGTSMLTTEKSPRVKTAVARPVASPLVNCFPSVTIRPYRTTTRTASAPVFFVTKGRSSRESWSMSAGGGLLVAKAELAPAMVWRR